MLVKQDKGDAIVSPESHKVSLTIGAFIHLMSMTGRTPDSLLMKEYSICHKVAKTQSYTKY